MVDASVIAAKLGELDERIGRVRLHRPAAAEALRDDLDARDLVSFNLMLAVQSCLDVASHLIADEGWKPAASLAESFRRLAEHGVVSSQVADRLGKAAGLRHVVAHGYAGAEVDKIFAGATSGLTDLERFASEVAAWLRSRTG